MHNLIRRFNNAYVPGLSDFEKNRLFTDYEAWTLFRLAAFAEAIGWTLLIIGIVLKYGFLHGNDAPVAVAGSIHGMVFMFYAAIALTSYPSLGWGRLTGIVAIAASVPPYGSLVFEQVMHHVREYQSAQQFLAATTCSIVSAY